MSTIAGPWQDGRVNPAAPPAAKQHCSRRAVVTAIAVSGGYALISCTAEAPPPPPPPDPLEPLIAAATGNAALADSVAAAHPPLAAAARQIATDRRAHAGALAAEIRRATPTPVTTSPPAGRGGTASSGAISAPAPADPAAARTALLRATSDAQRQAADLVGALPRHRAGLVASVAACCASHAVVLG
jgi:hypothetical protein